MRRRKINDIPTTSRGRISANSGRFKVRETVSASSAGGSRSSRFRTAQSQAASAILWRGRQAPGCRQPSRCSVLLRSTCGGAFHGSRRRRWSVEHPGIPQGIQRSQKPVHAGFLWFAPFHFGWVDATRSCDGSRRCAPSPRRRPPEIERFLKEWTGGGVGSLRVSGSIDRRQRRQVEVDYPRPGAIRQIRRMPG